MEKSGAWIIHKPSEGTELTAMKTQFPHYLEEHRLIHSHGAWVGPYFNQCLLMCLQEPRGALFPQGNQSRIFLLCLRFVLASRVMEKAHKRYMDAPIHLSIIPGFFFPLVVVGRRSGSWWSKTRKTWGWWCSSVVKNNCCSYRGPVFSSQHLHDGPQLSATPVPGYGSAALFWIPQTLHTPCALVSMQANNHTYNKNKCKN